MKEKTAPIQVQLSTINGHFCRRTVKPIGNGYHVTVPGDWKKKRVLVVLEDESK